MRIVCLFLLVLFQQTVHGQEAVRTDRKLEQTSGRLVFRLASLKNSRPNPNYNPPASRTESGLIVKKTYKESNIDFGTRAGKDPVIQRFRVPRPREGSIRSGAVISSNYEGQFYTTVSPADPTIAVGPNHIIQMVNGSKGAYIKVTDKAGNVLVPSRYMHDMMTNPDYFGYGDPVVLFDPFANRFFISEFGSDSCATCYANVMVVAVSQTPDPTAGWNFYKFKPGYFFIDFPKYAAWPNALFASSNDYNITGSNYLGSSVYAIDKTAMINGNSTATLQQIRLSTPSYPKYVSMAPVNISGAELPKNPDEGMFVYFNDDNRTFEDTDRDSLGIIRFKPDFRLSSASRLVFDEPMEVAPFKSRVCNGSRDCVPSAEGAGYDELSDRIMNKVYYRNFGTYEALVLNHTVDANYPSGTPVAAIRWYELQRTSASWQIAQQGTYAPDENGRFMASMNINSRGQIGMVFNHSGPGLYASIYFTGRNQEDQPGIMTYFETPVAAGDQYGTFANRWGDYNELVLDPADDSTFWLTAMYGSLGWKTKISSFRLQSLPKQDLRIVSILAPEPKYASCDSVVQPVIQIRNSGIQTQDSVNISTYIDDVRISALPWNGPLMPNASAEVKLPALVLPKGRHELRYVLERPDGSSDDIPFNDTAKLSFTVISPLSTRVSEDFEPADFPPFQWRVINTNKNTLTWERSSLAGYKSAASVVNRLFENRSLVDSDLIISPPVITDSSDSLILSFDRAYKIYGKSDSFADTLEILVTTDCGQHFQSIWKKGGAELASVFGSLATGFVPNQSDWLHEQIDIKPYIQGASQAAVAFRSISLFGQNIYLDNIELRPRNREKNDAAMISVSSPSPTICATAILPEIQIQNRGLDTLTSLTAKIELNNILTDSLVWTGKLAPGDSARIGWTVPIAIKPGRYSVRLYLSSPNGQPDSRPDNDTARYSVTVFSGNKSQVKEGFESAQFPPDDWHLLASTRGYSWELNTNRGKNSSQSMWSRNIRYNSNGLKEDLYSPLINIPRADSIYISFDHAYGNIDLLSKSDTLEILITKDCGKTMQSLFKKWGRDLNTIPSVDPYPVYPPEDTIGFIPLAHQWKHHLIDISKEVQTRQDFQVIFRSVSNEGSNLYIDNIEVYGVNLPPGLKANGYQIFPNPFSGSIGIRHLGRASKLREVVISNAVGQRVFSRTFSGNAPDYFTVDLGRHPSGVYQVQLRYTDKNITERIIKIK